MMESQNGLLKQTESHIQQFFEEHFPPEFVFHDFPHTKNVVEAAVQIGQAYQLSDQEMEVLQLAAWFHDTGYYKNPASHEELSCRLAEAFLNQHNYTSEGIRAVTSCIEATRVPQNPQNLMEEILCDADLSHLGNERYWDRCGRLRQEMLMTKDILMSEQEWVDFELDFMIKHRYHTEVARNLFGKQKNQHIKQLLKQKQRLDPDAVKGIEPGLPEKKKKKKKNSGLKLKELNLGRGVETMYRTTYRTHVNLSSIADNKANIMLSINAIIISIVVANLVPKIPGDYRLAVPTLILLAVCLIALVYAILSTRPKVTQGRATREDIAQKRTNLLFFGNFYRMDLADFHWGMMEMIKDSDFLYSSMTRDLYYLGVVLAKKYQYLRICYNVFMYGLIVAVAAFAAAFLFWPAPV
ncbi:MAG: HD domain-containing protein [Phaeodactylibacter sp.]|nr:HD domain-containing protein [Phaeodactylibacter sp.]MCB9051071.1 HD domain-containing protein [Lewinellaceae bacterium]